MYTFHKLERENYREVFETTPSRPESHYYKQEGTDPLEAQLNSEFPPVGRFMRDSNNNVVGVIVIYNYGIKNNVKPAGPFQISSWITMAAEEREYTFLRLLEEFGNVIRDGDTSLFDVTPYDFNKKLQVEYMNVWLKMSKNLFISDNRLYLQNKDGEINDERRWK